MELAKKALAAQRYQDAIRLLKEAEIYPQNLGEGKLFGARENDIHFWLGCAYAELGDHQQAQPLLEPGCIG